MSNDTTQSTAAERGFMGSLGAGVVVLGILSGAKGGWAGMVSCLALGALMLLSSFGHLRKPGRGTSATPEPDASEVAQRLGISPMVDDLLADERFSERVREALKRDDGSTVADVAALYREMWSR